MAPSNSSLPNSPILINSSVAKPLAAGGLCMDASKNARVVLVHDWITGMRGGEKCLEVFCRRWPQSPLYTLLHKRGSVCSDIEQLPIHTSFLQFFPAVHRYYRLLLPLM